jgi:hypothetical protein
MTTKHASGKSFVFYDLMGIKFSTLGLHTLQHILPFKKRVTEANSGVLNLDNIQVPETPFAIAIGTTISAQKSC